MSSRLDRFRLKLGNFPSLVIGDDVSREGRRTCCLLACMLAFEGSGYELDGWRWPVEEKRREESTSLMSENIDRRDYLRTLLSRAVIEE